MWLEGRNLTVDAPTSPLPLNGHMVIGQEQDEWNVGYISSQSFLGQVTGLTTWDVALKSTELQARSCCERINADPLISWSELNWTLHNQTGYLRVSSSMPCRNHDDLLLFTLSLRWSEALAYLHRIGLEMAVPRSLKETTFLSQMIQENGQFCSVDVRTGYLDLVGVRRNTKNGNVEDIRGIEFKVENLSWKENPKSSHSSYMILDNSNPLELRYDLAACFTAKQEHPDVFRLRGLCEQDHETR